MKKIIYTAIFFCLISLTNTLQAQPPDPGGGSGGPSCFPPPCIPIDGGLSWLLIAGTIYGGKKVYDFSKEENKEG
jgi:hypothetical protein